VLLQHFSDRITAPVVLPLSWPTAKNRRIRLAIDELHRIVDEIVAHRRVTPRRADRPADLLDMLMAVEDEETGAPMSDGQLGDEVLTLLLAGHETTAAALGWTGWLLAKHQDVDRRLGEELAAGDSPLVGRVVQEAMRLYPPAWIVARRAEEA